MTVWSQGCSEFVHGCDKVVARLSQSYDKVAGTLQPCHNIVISVWEGCHNLGTFLSPGCQNAFLQPCHHLVTILYFETVAKLLQRWLLHCYHNLATTSSQNLQQPF